MFIKIQDFAVIYSKSWRLYKPMAQKFSFQIGSLISKARNDNMNN